MDEVELEYLEIDSHTGVERLSTSNKSVAELLRKVKSRLAELNSLAGNDGQYVVSKCSPGLIRHGDTVVRYEVSVFFRFIPCMPVREGIQEQFYVAGDAQ